MDFGVDEKMQSCEIARNAIARMSHANGREAVNTRLTNLRERVNKIRKVDVLKQLKYGC